MPEAEDMQGLALLSTGGSFIGSLSCMLLSRLDVWTWTHAGLRSRLAASPASAAAPYSQGQKRVALLVHALISAQVFSRAALARALAQDPSFLKQELLAWLQKVSMVPLLERCLSGLRMQSLGKTLRAC